MSHLLLASDESSFLTGIDVRIDAVTVIQPTIFCTLEPRSNSASPQFSAASTKTRVDVTLSTRPRASRNCPSRAAVRNCVLS